MDTYFSLSQKQTAEKAETTKDISTTSRFAATFKHLRLEKRWKQEDLAKALHVTQRAIVSWETGARIPSPGMVILLCLLLIDEQATNLLSHALLSAYLLDDIERQAKVHREEGFRDLADQGMQRLLEQTKEQQQPERTLETFPLPLPQTANGSRRVAEASQPSSKPVGQDHQQEEDSADTLQRLFVLFDQLRLHPELITVAHDFLREVAP